MKVTTAGRQIHYQIVSNAFIFNRTSNLGLGVYETHTLCTRDTGFVYRFTSLISTDI